MRLLAPWLLGLLAAEVLRPLRVRKLSRAGRLRVNLILAGTAAVPLRLLVVPTMLDIARSCQRHRLGLLPRLRLLSGGQRAVLGVLLLDATTYLWHRLNHGVPFLWRFHRVHHADADLDVSTAVRFHFGEVTLSTALHALQARVIAPTAATLITFEILLQAATMFHHSNWRLPRRIERLLLFALVTPRMHGIHHSILASETNTNFSVIFSVWDRLLGSARLGDLRQPIIGLPGVSPERASELGRLAAARLLVADLGTMP